MKARRGDKLELVVTWLFLRLITPTGCSTLTSTIGEATTSCGFTVSCTVVGCGTTSISYIVVVGGTTGVSCAVVSCDTTGCGFTVSCTVIGCSTTGCDGLFVCYFSSIYPQQGILVNLS
ncbi:hypothetical protein [Okeania sp. KiyG1]|uniref:hypothetical protein n=1 Tax=Okeania sp. KiyG1 TaxID=2720165 RepID=UPI001924DF39|nr:hypothetical protein [Okeania sp. KiyG1]GGA36034.1 hypothetical protein CYANOKiyG1_53780 [Okeania sp. KiyG1]